MTTDDRKHLVESLRYRAHQYAPARGPLSDEDLLLAYNVIPRERLLARIADDIERIDDLEEQVRQLREGTPDE